MSFFDDAGAWFDQAGKDAGQGFKDVTKAVFHDGPKDVMNEIATGDVMQGIWNAQDDFSQVVYDVFNPNNGPSADEIVDQIESTIGQQPTPDYITGPDFNEPAPALPSPITGPDFNEPAPALPSPGFKTFDPLTNPNPGLSSAFEFSEVGYDALSIDCINDSVLSLLNREEIADLMNYLLADGPVGRYNSIDSLHESLLNPIFEVAEIPMF